MRAENLPQILDFLVHAVQHLPHGVHFHFAAFEALQRETNCQMLGQLHDHGLIRFRIRRLRRQACQRLFQCVLRAAGQFRHLLLECSGGGHSALTRPHAPETSQRPQNRIDLIFARLSSSASSASGATSAAKRPHTGSSSQPSHYIGYRHTCRATSSPEVGTCSSGPVRSASPNTHSSTGAACTAPVTNSTTGTCTTAAS